MEERWYKLDNAAKIYPAIRESEWAPVFRIDTVLKEDVQVEVLQSALIMTYKRFPTFSVCITRGLFWYYFEPNDSEPEVMLESTYPLRTFSEEKDKGFLFRVLYYKKRISLEVFHSISDGFGAVVFLKTLLFNYFTIINGSEPVENKMDLEKYGILYYKDLPTPEETEDSFQYYALGNENLKLKENTAFKIPGTRLKRHAVRVTHVLADIERLKRLSKEYDATITEFLTALIIYSILEARLYNAAEKRPIKISVPVNLRKRFPSKTMRNFSSYINVEVVLKQDGQRAELREIVKVVSRQIREGVDVDLLRQKFSGNVQAEKNIMMRMAPLFLKNIVLKTTFSLYGERITTSTLSNVGNVILPESMSGKVDRFDFVLGAPKQNTMNCSVISFKNTVSISFTTIIEENTVLKEFVDFLVENGVEVSVETNY